ncbi:MAG: hypothetical protein U0V74_04670 [Chitinophagales bacterium]
MINKDLVTSGFDIELLLSEEYLKCILLSLYESETIPHFVPLKVFNEGQPTEVELSAFIIPPPDLATKRLYEVNPAFNPNPFGVNMGHPSVENAFSVEILSGGEVASVRLKASVCMLLDGSPFEPMEVDLFADIFLSSTEANGFQQNVLLNVEITDFESDVLEDFIRGLGSEEYDRQFILDQLRANISQHIDLGIVGKDKSVHRIEMKVFEGTVETPAAIGIYLNLKLQNGPEENSFLPDRGNIDDVQNFLPLQHNIAFALPGAIYERLGPDLKFRKGIQTSVCPPKFKYPDLFKGFILRDMSIGPEIITSSAGTYETNKLKILVSTEKEVDGFFDPDIDVIVTLKPVINDGIVSWEVDADVSGLIISLTMLLSMLLATGITFIFGPAAWVYLVVNASLLALETGGLIAFNELYVDGKADETVRDTNVLETIPHHLTISSKRWDPLYNTLHQLVASVVQMEIKSQGIFMLGKEIRLGVDFQPATDAEARSVTKDADNKITALQYILPGVESLDSFEVETATANREPYLNIYQPTGMSTYFVDVSVAQIEGRLQKKKIVTAIPYVAYKVAMDGGQIDKLLLVSSQELNSYYSIIFRQLKLVIESGHEDELTEEAINRLAAGGCDSTDEKQIELMYKKVLREKIDRQLVDKLTEYIDIILSQTFNPHLELTPEEIAEIEKKNIWVLVNRSDEQPLEMVTMRSGTVYFRDRKDSKVPDNLLSLPHFKPR